MSTTHAWTSYKEKVRQLSGQIVEAQRPIRVREAIKWDDAVEQQFMAGRYRQLPQVGPDYYAGRAVAFRARPTRSPNSRTSSGKFSICWASTIRSATSCCATAGSTSKWCGCSKPAARRCSTKSRASCTAAPRITFAGDTTTLRELGLLLYEILSGIPEDGLGAVYPKKLTAEEVRRAAEPPLQHLFPRQPGARQARRRHPVRRGGRRRLRENQTRRDVLRARSRSARSPRRLGPRRQQLERRPATRRQLAGQGPALHAGHPGRAGRDRRSDHVQRHAGPHQNAGQSRAGLRQGRRRRELSRYFRVLSHRGLRRTRIAISTPSACFAAAWSTAARRSPRTSATAKAS